MSQGCDPSHYLRSSCSYPLCDTQVKSRIHLVCHLELQRSKYVFHTYMCQALSQVPDKVSALVKLYFSRGEGNNQTNTCRAASVHTYSYKYKHPELVLPWVNDLRGRVLTDMGEWGGNSQEGERGSGAIERACTIILSHAQDSHLAEWAVFRASPHPFADCIFSQVVFVNC